MIFSIFPKRIRKGRELAKQRQRSQRNREVGEMRRMKKKKKIMMGGDFLWSMPLIEEPSMALETRRSQQNNGDRVGVGAVGRGVLISVRVPRWVSHVIHVLYRWTLLRSPGLELVQSEGLSSCFLLRR